MTHDNPHDHDHAHEHDHSLTHDQVSEFSPDDPEARARALQSLLVEKGLVSTEAVDEAIRAYEQDIGPLNGAKVVVRAWLDDQYRERLLEDGKAAVSEFGFDHGIDDLVFVENTPDVHNVVVCTLCSCYPWSILGLPPTWYKSEAYRARIVREPRTVLAEFGLELPEGIDVRVWDSSSDLRYAVLPQPPTDVEKTDEAELLELVTRDTMVGVDRVVYP